MSINFVSFCFLVLSSCILMGCGGGGGSEPVASTDTSAAPSPPAAPSSGAPATEGGTPSSGSSSSGPRIDSSTPDGTVKEAMQAIQDNEFERVWDLMPKNYQTEVNALFQEFGNQVDPELWDKTFVLLNRFVSVVIAKEDMLYQTPEAKMILTQAQAPGGLPEGVDAESLTPQKIKTITAPLLSTLTTLLNSQLGSSQKLKSFDGRVFCNKTLDSLARKMTELSELSKAEIEKMGGLPGGSELPAGMMMSADLEAMFDRIKVRTESTESDFAEVVIEYPGFNSNATVTPDGDANIHSMKMEAREEKMNFVRLDGKWVPEVMGREFPGQIATAKAMIPVIAAEINSQKSRIMPALAQIEPLIDALDKAKTQEEFNTAFVSFYSQAPLIVASAAAMPGLSAKFGGGSIQVSPVTIKLHVTGPMTDAHLSELIQKLEALTDDPDRAITLPSWYVGNDGQPVTSGEQPAIVAAPEKRNAQTINALKITPVSDPQAFADAITFAEDVQFDPRTKIITLSLKYEAPPRPAETPNSEK